MRRGGNQTAPAVLNLARIHKTVTITKAWRQVRLLLVVGDVFTVALTYVVADYLRTRLWLGKDWPEVLPGFDSALQVHYWALAVLAVVWPVLLHWLHWYEPGWQRTRWYAARAIRGALIIGMLLAGMALFVRREAFPRMQIVAFTALLPATTLVMRSISSLLGQWIASRQERHVLIVGAGRDAVRLRRLLRASSLGRSVVLGHLTLPQETAEDRPETGALLGDVSRLTGLLDHQVVDEVFFAVRVEQLPAILPYVRLCEEVGVVSHVLAESMVCHSLPEVESFHGVPMFAYSPTRHSPEMLVIKRGLDLAIAALAIVVTAPIMLICAIVIRASGPGPILFRQRRSGLNGRPFEMLKFRTMVPDAERRLAEVAHLNQSSGPVFKIADDPRLTRAGAILRRFSLDELPQFFNVVRGDMSIVGPRPPLPDEVSQYDRWQRRRLSMRPGLTCLWQVKGRHLIPFDEWMRLDLFYIDHWSLKLDFLIMCKTVVAVLSGSGA